MPLVKLRPELLQRDRAVEPFVVLGYVTFYLGPFFPAIWLQISTPLSPRSRTARSTRTSRRAGASEKLAEYRRKRDFSKTAEPAGKTEPARSHVDPKVRVPVYGGIGNFDEPCVEVSQHCPPGSARGIRA